MGEPSIAVSVIVPVRNGRAQLRELLRGLERQTLAAERFEVIVGDDGSTDGSAEGIETGDGRIRVVPGRALNAFAARNRAARNARGRMLAFVDADCVPEPEWLVAGLQALDESEIAGGLVRLRAPARPTIWTLVSLDSFHDQELAVRRGHGLTGNLFVHRDLFETVGGFDEQLPSGGDFDLVSRCIATGGRLILARDAVVWHPTFDDARSLLWRIWYDGRARAARTSAAGDRPPALRLRWWVPVIPVARARKRIARPLLLDRTRLAANGITVRSRDLVRSAAVLYLLVPYLSGIAQLVGWWDARGVGEPRRSSAPSTSK